MILEISTDERFASSLQHIRTKVSAIKSVNCSISADDIRQTITINASEGQRKQIVSTVIDAISEIVITDFKSFYIQNHINIPISDPITRHAFFKALVTFDRDTDKIIAKTMIKLTPSFLLDSFYEFMIDILKQRWDEVCYLANENICYLVCQKTFSELLRFLISNIDSLSDEAHLFVRGDDIEILGRGLKPLNDIYINHTLPPNIKAVTKLVAIAPKKIFLHKGTDYFDENLINSIQNLFGSCVVVM